MLTVKSKIIYAVSALVVIVGIVLVSNWLSRRGVESYTERLRQEFLVENQAIFDNIARIKARQEILSEQYKSAKRQLNTIRQVRKNEFDNVVTRNNPDEIADFFDKTIDNIQLSSENENN